MRERFGTVLVIVALSGAVAIDGAERARFIPVILRNIYFRKQIEKVIQTEDHIHKIEEIQRLIGSQEIDHCSTQQ